MPGLEPVEHLPTGFLVTLWERLDGVAAQAADRSLSHCLAALHVALARTRTKLPSFRAGLMRARPALDDDTFMAALAPADRTFLRAVYDAGLAQLDGLDLDRQPLHVEPHDGNRILTTSGQKRITGRPTCGSSAEADECPSHAVASQAAVSDDVP